MASASAQHGRCLEVFRTRLGPDGHGFVVCADLVVCAIADVLFELDRDGVGAGSERDARFALGDMLLVLQLHADDGRVFAGGCCVVYHLLTMYRLEAAAKVAAETLLHVQHEREREAAQEKRPVAPVCALMVLHAAFFDLGAPCTEGQLALARRLYLNARNATPVGSQTHSCASEYLAASAGGLPPVSGSPAYAEAQARQAAAAAARAADWEASKKAAAEARAMIDELVRIAKPLMAAIDTAASAVERGLLEPPVPPTAEPSAAASWPRRASDVLSSEELNAAAEAWDRRQSEAQLKAQRKAAAAMAAAAADEAAATDEEAEAAAARAESVEAAAARAEELVVQLERAHITGGAASSAAGAGRGRRRRAMTRERPEAAEPGAEPRAVLL
jgi:hypothetical protein